MSPMKAKHLLEFMALKQVTRADSSVSQKLLTFLIIVVDKFHSTPAAGVGGGSVGEGPSARVKDNSQTHSIRSEGLRGHMRTARAVAFWTQHVPSVPDAQDSASMRCEGTGG